MCSWNLSAHSIKRSVSEARATFRITFTMSRAALITEVRSAACAIVVACSWCLKSRTACRSVTTACSISWVGELPSVCSCANFLVYSFTYVTTLSRLYRRMNLNHQLGRFLNGSDHGMSCDYPTIYMDGLRNITRNLSQEMKSGSQKT